MRHFATFSNVGARRDEWKACCIGKKWELYNIDKDVSEAIDLSSQFPEVLESLVRETEAWSRTHTEPRWFDNEQARKRWKENGMPNYEVIFPNP